MDVSEIISQLQNDTLPALTRAELIDKATFLISKKQLAELINKSPSYISNHLRLLQLPEIIKDGLMSGHITEGHARAISFLDDSLDMIKLYEGILRRNLSVRDTEDEASRMRKTKREYGKVEPEVVRQVEQITVKWGVVARIVRKDRSLILTMSFPLGIVFLRKLQSILKRLLRE